MCSTQGRFQTIYQSCYNIEIPTERRICKFYNTLPDINPHKSTDTCRDCQQRLTEDYVKNRPEKQVSQPLVFPAPINKRHKGSKYCATSGHRNKAEPPQMTREPKADMVRNLPQKYEDQKYEDRWDWQQFRSSTHRQCDPCRERLLRRRHISTVPDEDKQDQTRDLVNQGSLPNIFVKQLHGYTGYNPMCPPETGRLDGIRKCPQYMISTMAASYKKFPAHEYKTPASKSYAREQW